MIGPLLVIRIKRFCLIQNKKQNKNSWKCVLCHSSSGCIITFNGRGRFGFSFCFCLFDVVVAFVVVVAILDVFFFYLLEGYGGC